MSATVLKLSDFGDGVRYDPESKAVEIDTEDGGVIIDFNPSSYLSREEGDHDENLAEVLTDTTLSMISSTLLLRIAEDDMSRADWLSDRSKGIDLLGLKIENPRTDLGSSSAPMEGMSTARHPVLLEACLRFQSNAASELLPSNGPVKVASTGTESIEGDAQAQLLEDDMNTFLTVTCPEYVPDTDKMLFTTGWSGAGFKKLYHCPLKRRPTSQSVDAKDLIVSSSATDIASAARVTHVIKMDEATLVRMQLVGAYRDVQLASPEPHNTVLDKKIKRTQGITPSNSDPKDIDRTIYECYCNYDIPGFEHKDEKGNATGLPLPYKVSIDLDSRKILEIRRNWKEDDKECAKRNNFVMYPFVPMFGFYPVGLLYILGNTTNALTAAWRIVLDAGMFGNFPGFLYLKSGNRQANNSFRVAPGSGAPVDAAGNDIRSAVMALPYKEAGPGFVQFIDNVATNAQRLGGTAEVQVSEGRQDAPVGTTLALIEQAQKIISAVHRRLHTAQAQEFQILKELLKEDPEALWRHRTDKKVPWDAESLVAALNNYDLVPKADPNTPSQMHRLMKVMALKQMQSANPDIYDPRVVDEYCLEQIGVSDPQRFFVNAQPNAQPNPNIIKAQSSAAIAQTKAQSSVAIAQTKSQADARNAQLKLLDIQTRAAEGEKNRASKERIEGLKIAERLAVHPQSQAILASQNPGI
jgi:hypothetical protein